MPPRKRKHAGTARRRWPLIIAAVIGLLLALLIYTEPRQLPGLVADQPAVRVAYGWRDTTARWLHRQIYPLSALREDEPQPANTGTGYNRRDRDALDDLINTKKEIKDTP